MDSVVEERRRSRKYDILLLGATGYTGSLTAEHIVRHLPFDLKWAIAGRSKSKLESLASKLKELDPERIQPDIEVVKFDDPRQLGSVVKNSKVCISVVLYWQVGEVVVKSCVENGTDYIDVAGDIPLLRTFIDQYHEAALDARIACSPDRKIFSPGPQRESWRRRADVSGGTASSMLAESTYDSQSLKEAKEPWVLSPIKRSQTSAPTNFLNMRKDPTLGLLSRSSFSAEQNRALVHRTWALLQDTDQAYGPNFEYNEYIKVSSAVGGILRLLTLVLVRGALKFGPSRRLLGLVLPKPGEGPDVEKERASRIKFEAIATADTGSNPVPRAYASFSYPSGSYHTTALFLAQGAASLLYTRNLANHVPGGCLTPAFLGEDLWKRLQNAGAVLRVNLL
ncbi:hypothetical protein Daesc_006032 [Daldinia eschscholtzii]|uniref:Saccharopine dehydrogenase NADP binding domain-containing protein n=1 Tax=Daldinia eschscholtzii TaxID=292717 RepID=A0AAX6MH61_9PEZI